MAEPPILGFLDSSLVKNLPADAGEVGSIPELRKIPWRRKWQLTPVFLPGKFPSTKEPGGLQSTESQRVRPQVLMD